MGIYDPCPPTGIYDCSDDGVRAALTFLSNTRSLSSAGELLTSWANTVTITGDLIPGGGAYPRFLAGTVERVDYEFIYQGNAAVTVGNRTTISGLRIEVVNVDHFGIIQTEILMKELGR